MRFGQFVAVVAVSVISLSASVQAQQFLVTVSLQSSSSECQDPPNCEKEKIVAHKLDNAAVIARCLGVEPQVPEVAQAVLIYDWVSGNFEVVRRCDGQILCTVAQFEFGDCATASTFSTTSTKTKATCVWFYSMLGGDFNASLAGSEQDSETDTAFDFKAKYTLQSTIDGSPCTGKVGVGGEFLPAGNCQ